MAEIGGGALGAAATVAAAAYTSAARFSARHDQSHDAQAAGTRRLIDAFQKAHRDGDIADEDYETYMRMKDVYGALSLVISLNIYLSAIRSDKEYRDSISSFKETSSLKIVTKLSRQKEVRRRKRQARKANQDLQEHFYASSSGTSDASSTTAESGSPPGSGLGDENIRQWALGIEDVPPLPPLPFMKVKVHFHEFLFVILVPMVTEYGYLVERIWRKVRLCGGCPDDGLLRVRYRDEDGDLITIGSTDDVQMVFEEHRPGGCVTVFVS